MTAFVCAHAGSENQDDTFRPVGAFINWLTQQLAWEDSSMRDVADYYRRAKLPGSGSGTMRPWPASVLSDETRAGIEQGKLTNGVPWDDWSVAGM